MAHQGRHAVYQHQFPRIAASNKDWPPSTPEHKGPSTLPSTTSFPVSTLPSLPPREARSLPYPGFPQDSFSSIASDPVPDVESDGWYTDDESPSVLPSRGGQRLLKTHCHWCMQCLASVHYGHSGYLEGYKSISDSLLNPMADELMEGVCERLETLVDTLCEPVLTQTFDGQKLVNFQYDVLSILYALSDSGLMDCNFDTNPSGFLHHQSLGIMWNILE